MLPENPEIHAMVSAARERGDARRPFSLAQFLRSQIEGWDMVDHTIAATVCGGILLGAAGKILGSDAALDAAQHIVVISGGAAGIKTALY